MALFEGESLEEVLAEEANQYLDNPDLGISLIKKMLGRYREGDELEEFDEIVSREIFPILAELELKNELEIYRGLIKISSKLKEQKKIQILEGKKVLGVGGKFSAGKSCFINAITNAGLPEGQRPTTSIATYIVNSDKAENVAITNCDKLINLDDEAVEALTHEFYDRYRIGFSRLIKNLVIYTPEFTYPNIAILDTPGYTKSDETKKEDASDAELARQQLRAVDYLIWLVDSVQGVITERDLEFISSLNISSQILVVFTKADCEEMSNLERKLKEARNALDTINKDIFDVIAYDSVSGETVIGKDSLNQFLDMINSDCVENQSTEIEISNLSTQLDFQLKEQLADLQKRIDMYEKIIVDTSQVEHILSIVCEYGKCRSEYQKLVAYRKKLQDCFQRLVVIAKNMKVVK